MSRPFLSPLAAAAVLLAAAPALADPSTPGAAAPGAAESGPQAAAPAASCEVTTKKVQELEARLRESEAKVAQLIRDRIPTPPDSHADSN
jgi:hypothetical protein